MEEEKKSWTKEEIIKLSVIVILLLAIFIYSIIASNKNIISNKNSFDKTDVQEIFKPIEDNYSLLIDKTINDKNEKIEYINDGTFKLYNIDNDNKGYLIYKDKTYIVEPKGFKIKEYSKNVEAIKDNLYNINFIKSIVKYCDLKNTRDNETDCYINVSDYINNYNNYFYTNYLYDGDDKIIFNFHYGNIVNNIKVDYSKVYEIMKNSNDKVIYNIKIDKVNLNDYSNLFEVFSNTLKK